MPVDLKAASIPYPKTADGAAHEIPDADVGTAIRVLYTMRSGFPKDHVAFVETTRVIRGLERCAHGANVREAQKHNPLRSLLGRMFGEALAEAVFPTQPAEAVPGGPFKAPERGKCHVASASPLPPPPPPPISAEAAKDPDLGADAPLQPGERRETKGKNLMVVRNKADVAAAQEAFPDWEVVTSGTPLTGMHFARIVMSSGWTADRNQRMALDWYNNAVLHRRVDPSVEPILL